METSLMALGERLSLLEKALGTPMQPNSTPQLKELEEVRRKLIELRMDFVLKVPIEDLEQLHVKPSLADSLTLGEKAMIVTQSSAAVDEYATAVADVQRNADIVFNSTRLTNVPPPDVIEKEIEAEAEVDESLLQLERDIDRVFQELGTELGDVLAQISKLRK